MLCRTIGLVKGPIKRFKSDGGAKLSLKNAMINALHKIKQDSGLEHIPEEITKTDTFHAKKTISMNSKILFSMKNKLKANKESGVRDKESVLTKINVSDMSTEKIINSPMYQHMHRVKNELRAIRKNNVQEIKKFRDLEVLQNENTKPPQDKQYLAYKGFFRMVEDMILNIKLKEPNYYKFLSNNGFLRDLDPTKFTPSDLNMPEYPGTIRGDNPEDDPDFFQSWITQNLSPLMLKILSVFGANVQFASRTEHGGIRHYTPADWASIPNVMGDKLEAGSDLLKNLEENSFSVNYTQDTFDMDLEALPPKIHSQEEAVHQWIEMMSLSKIFKAIQKGEEFGKTYDIKANAEEIDLDKEYYPTVYSYYQLLPEKMRNDERIQDMARWLEKYSPANIPLEERQRYLNLACAASAPLSEEAQYSTDVLLNTKRTQYTPKQMEEFILLHEIQFPDAWGLDHEVDLSLTQEDKMKIESKLERFTHDFYRETPIREEKKADNYKPLPHEFYDNEDGFYDEYIQQKMMRRGSVPLLKTRPHLKH